MVDLRKSFAGLWRTLGNNPDPNAGFMERVRSIQDNPLFLLGTAAMGARNGGDFAQSLSTNFAGLRSREQERARDAALQSMFDANPEMARFAEAFPEAAAGEWMRTRQETDTRAREDELITGERDYSDRVRREGYEYADEAATTAFSRQGDLARLQAELQERAARSRLTGEPFDVYVGDQTRRVVGDGQGGFRDLFTGEPIDASAMALEKPLDSSGVETALADRQSRASNVMTAIDRAQEQSTPWTTGWRGAALRLLGGTPAANLSATVDEISANVGFSELQRMRDNSPTGGALGQVSNREIELLTSALGSLKQSQSEPQFDENLGRVFDAIVGAQERLRAAYVADYGREPPDTGFFALADEVRERLQARDPRRTPPEQDPLGIR